MRQWRVSDVMTRDVVTVTPDTGYQHIADLLVSRKVSAVPVVDDDGRVLGVVSEADLLAKLEYTDREPYHPLALRRLGTTRGKAGGEKASDLMSAPPVTISADSSVSGAARLIDAAGVKRLPVVDEDGRLLGIVARRDLVRLYARTDEEIRAAVRDVLVGLWIAPDDIDVTARAGVVTLRGQVDRKSTVGVVVGFVRSTPGVVEVIDELTFEHEDRPAADTRWHRSHPFSAQPHPFPDVVV